MVKLISDHITDLYLQWNKRQNKYYKKYKKANQQNREFYFGYLSGLSGACLELAELKFKAIMIEMLNKTPHQRKVEEREKTNRPLWAGSKDFKDWQPKEE